MDHAGHQGQSRQHDNERGPCPGKCQWYVGSNNHWSYHFYVTDSPVVKRKNKKGLKNV